MSLNYNIDRLINFIVDKNLKANQVKFLGKAQFKTVKIPKSIEDEPEEEVSDEPEESTALVELDNPVEEVKPASSPKTNAPEIPRVQYFDEKIYNQFLDQNKISNLLDKSIDDQNKVYKSYLSFASKNPPHKFEGEGESDMIRYLEAGVPVKQSSKRERLIKEIREDALKDDTGTVPEQFIDHITNFIKTTASPINDMSDDEIQQVIAAEYVRYLDKDSVEIKSEADEGPVVDEPEIEPEIESEIKSSSDQDRRAKLIEYIYSGKFDDNEDADRVLKTHLTQVINDPKTYLGTEEEVNDLLMDQLMKVATGKITARSAASDALMARHGADPSLETPVTDAEPTESPVTAAEITEEVPKIVSEYRHLSKWINDDKVSKDLIRFGDLLKKSGINDPILSELVYNRISEYYQNLGGDNRFKDGAFNRKLALGTLFFFTASDSALVNYISSSVTGNTLNGILVSGYQRITSRVKLGKNYVLPVLFVDGVYYFVIVSNDLNSILDSYRTLGDTVKQKFNTMPTDMKIKNRPIVTSINKDNADYEFLKFCGIIDAKGKIPYYGVNLLFTKIGSVKSQPVESIKVED